MSTEHTMVDIHLPASIPTITTIIGALTKIAPDGIIDMKSPSNVMRLVVPIDGDADPEAIDVTAVDQKGIAFDGSAPLAVNLVAAFRDLLNTHAAPNYVTFTVTDTDTVDSWEVTIRRPGGKTPAEKIGELNATIAELEATVAELQA